jgi:hypothetical protein
VPQGNLVDQGGTQGLWVEMQLGPGWLGPEGRDLGLAPLGVWD